MDQTLSGSSKKTRELVNCVIPTASLEMEDTKEM
jgi:hypothetical protein